MDPDKALHELREMAGEVRASGLNLTAVAMAERFEELDGWLSKGGFLPGAWRETEDHR